MKGSYLFLIILLLSANIHCAKKTIVSIHTGLVLAATCDWPSSQVAVQLDNNDPLSSEWTNRNNDSVYKNVVITFDKTLRRNINKSFNYTIVRKTTSADTAHEEIIPLVCIIYPTVVFENIAIK